MNNNSFSLAFTSDVYRMRKLKSVWVSLIIMFLAIFLTFAVYWIGMKIIENTPPRTSSGCRRHNADFRFADSKSAIWFVIDCLHRIFDRNRRMYIYRQRLFKRIRCADNGTGCKASGHLLLEMVVNGVPVLLLHVLCACSERNLLRNQR